MCVCVCVGEEEGGDEWEDEEEEEVIGDSVMEAESGAQEVGRSCDF